MVQMLTGFGGGKGHSAVGPISLFSLPILTAFYHVVYVLTPISTSCIKQVLVYVFFKTRLNLIKQLQKQKIIINILCFVEYRQRCTEK